MSTSVEQVRLLIADTNTDPDVQLFTDTDLQAFLDLEDQVVKLAAADALDAIATSEALVSKVLRTQDLQTDGAKLADALRAHADRLRNQADGDDFNEWGGFDLVPTRTGRPCVPEHTGRVVEWDRPPEAWGL